MEYASSPVEQPIDQTRRGSWRDRFLVSRGKTLVLSASNASGFRKKLVTLMRTS
jgi:hypothetical protein